MNTHRNCAKGIFVLLFAIGAIASPARAQAPVSQSATSALRAEVQTLFSAMIAAFKQDPATVARYYDDDAQIIGGPGRMSGRKEIDAYWQQARGFTNWTLEIDEVGGGQSEPWVLGKSVLTGESGRSMATVFVGILRRGADGQLRFHIDMYTRATTPAR